MAFLLAFGFALGITALIELVRWARGSGDDKTSPATDTETIAEILTQDDGNDGDVTNAERA